MKILGSVGMVLAVVGICLAPYAVAAGKYDGSVPLLCVPTSVTECGVEGDCRRGTPESVNLPQFFKVDLKAMTIRSEETGRESPIRSVERMNGRIIMQGAQAERGWTLVVSEDTGKMSETISAEGEGFVIFGVCTLMP